MKDRLLARAHAMRDLVKTIRSKEIFISTETVLVYLCEAMAATNEDLATMIELREEKSQ